jgi:DNA-binding NtrC family response regulator
MTVILTVEDEFLISEYLGHVLEEVGYDVISTSNADEASKYPPAKPGALCCEPLKAAIGGAHATPVDVSRLKAARGGR